jgi:glycosyltransferase involved in cell wall biosynthesis
MVPEKFLLVHNEYGALSGEEVEFSRIGKLLVDHGHAVHTYSRTSSKVTETVVGRLKAAASGIYSISSRREVAALVDRLHPDYVLVQNLFPLISPGVLPMIAKAGVPLLMRVANYRLMCPNGLHFSHGQVCEKCLHGREYWCVLKNCEEDLFKSIAYAMRSATSRLMGWYRDNVAAYLCASRFLRDRMLAAGFEAARVQVIPNAVWDGQPYGAPEPKDVAPYAGYVGRISQEKGIPILLEVARRTPDIPFRLAGRVRPSFPLPRPLPDNVTLEGFLEGDALTAFYRGARLVVNVSQCFETFGMSIAEAMLHGKPVVAPNAGVFPEIVQEGLTGLLVDASSANAISDRVRRLWDNPGLCLELGRAAKEWASREYSPERYYERFSQILALPNLRERPTGQRR